MKIFLLFAFLIGAAVSQDDTCKNDFRTAVQCMVTEFDNTSNYPEFKPDYRAKVTTCFQNVGCTPPDFDGDPFADADFIKIIIQKYESLTPDQKECIRKKFRARVQQKLEQCLNEPMPPWAVDAMDQIGQENQLTDAQKADMKRALIVNVNVLKSARGCANKETLGKCLIDARADYGREACSRQQTCAKDASDTCKQQANQFRDKVCKCMEKAKQEMQQQMQAADANPMTAISAVRDQAGGWQADLNQCGIDTTAIMNEVKPKVMDYMTKKCNEATGVNLGTGPVALMLCMQRMQQTRGGEIKNLFATLKDYMEQHGGVKEAFCNCSL